MTVANATDSIRITGICGSLSVERATKKSACQGAAEYNTETALLELRDFNLVFYGSIPVINPLISGGMGGFAHGIRSFRC